jgi:phenylpropionate dioxygenase-like ring-hydroxylating dioxygenase large terminal subunit
MFLGKGPTSCSHSVYNRDPLQKQTDHTFGNLTKGAVVRASGVEAIGEAVRNRWHPIAPLEALQPGTVRSSRLLGQRLTIQVDDAGLVEVRHADVGTGSTPRILVPTISKYCYLWACLGDPTTPLFAIPEVDEPGRRVLHAGTIGVHVSAPRAVENFLDMAHFPYVHTNILGVEPYTDVAEYEVHIDADTNDLWATDCVFWQPVAATTSTEGQMTDYLYRVPHPYCVILYKTSPVDERNDVIALFCTPVAEDFIEANMFLCLLDDSNSTAMIRDFQLTIFGQDKPILENQYPKLLPLDPRAETPIRADKIAIAYRRWLTELGVDYAVIPAP